MAEWFDGMSARRTVANDGAHSNIIWCQPNLLPFPRADADTGIRALYERVSK